MPKVWALNSSSSESAMSTPAEPHFQMRLEGNFSQLTQMNTHIQSWGEQLHWTQTDIYRTQFVLEEMFVNSITHGSVKGKSMWASFSLKQKPQGLEIEWRDNGIAFNPLLAPCADPQLGLDERQPGGWGVTMVRRMGQDAFYERQNIGHEDINCLRWFQPWSLS